MEFGAALLSLTNKQTNKQKQTEGSDASPHRRLSLFVVAVVRLLLTQAALIDVLQRVGALHRQLRHIDARQRVLLRKHPRLQVRVVLPLPLRILLGRLVDLSHRLRKEDTERLY